MSGVSYPYRYAYEHVAASQTAQVLGTTGAKGDYIHRLICTVTTAATGNVVLVDGSGIGVYNVEINAVSADGAWKVTTGAGVEVMAVGIFSV